jgi:choline dehydrogenase-like flavoprotein
VIFPAGATARTDHETAAEEVYDAVVVGAGISGSIIANELSKAGKRVLVLEAGPGEDVTLAGYEAYVERFYGTWAKDNQSPYPRNANAPMPRSTDARKIRPGQPDASAYLVQNGPFSSDTTYTRVLSGTTMHWEGKVPRMLPEDFQMRKRFGQGLDWPLSYDDLEPLYQRAEQELGVSADLSEQAPGTPFPDDYVFPMKGLPLSYLDKVVAKGIDGAKVELDGEQFELKVRAFPQARNGIPNPDYVGPDGSTGYVPVGAISTHQVEEGERCQGNNNCVPICPVQAKYHAGKTLAQAMRNGERVHLLAQAVASRIHTDSNGRVAHIEYKHYSDPTSPAYTTRTARGHIYVLCANAIENPRLLLASGLPSTSGLVGRNLMDHAYLLSWALLPEVAGTMRGTNCTGGIVDMRRGKFQSRQAAFAVDIHNDGWGWAIGSPYTDLVDLVDNKNKFGATLRRDLVDQITRQLLLAFMIDVPPMESNRVTADPSYTDALGNMRPVVTYNPPEYTMRGVQYAREFARRIFQRLGAADHTAYHPDDYGYLTYEGEGFALRGGNHLAGTHVMGTDASNSVVNSYQRSWDHDNLYLCGGGSMPSIGTSNVTLTLSALCFRTAEDIIDRLATLTAPTEMASA